jgi:hypothetical protein
MRVSWKVLAFTIGTMVAALAGPAFASDPSYLVVGAGSWQIARDNARGAEFDLAYRPNLELWVVKPHVGVVAASDGDVYGYAGLLGDIHVLPHLVLTLSGAMGGYTGHGYRLGSHFEFRSGGEIAWQFDDQSRFGLGFYQISNAGLTRTNGGSESLLLTYSYPLGL